MSERKKVINYPVENKSGQVPLGHAVLVLTQMDTSIKSTTLIIPDEVKDRMNSIETRAIVVDVGPEAWKKESQPRARIGDVVLIARYSGHLIKGAWGGEAYRMVNDNDIFSGVTELE
jgi:co-chaperonin GroES (HSP10)